MAEKVIKKSENLEEKAQEGIDFEKINNLLTGADSGELTIDDSRNYIKQLIGAYNKLQQEYNKLKESKSKAPERRGLFAFLKKDYAQTKVSKVIANYKQKLGAGIQSLLVEYQKLVGLEGKYGDKRIGKIGEHRLYSEFKADYAESKGTLKELIKYRPAAAIASAFLFLGIFLLAFSQANLSGFAIGSKFVEVTTTFILGFIFLLLGAVLLFLVLRKQRHIHSLVAQQKSSNKKSVKKAKKTKQKAVKNKAKKRK